MYMKKLIAEIFYTAIENQLVVEMKHNLLIRNSRELDMCGQPQVSTYLAVRKLRLIIMFVRNMENVGISGGSMRLNTLRGSELGIGNRCALGIRAR